MDCDGEGDEDDAVKMTSCEAGGIWGDIERSDSLGLLHGYTCECKGAALERGKGTHSGRS